jgi:mannose-6-phosphate isomerase-like protein (cupin superfamily)
LRVRGTRKKITKRRRKDISPKSAQSKKIITPWGCWLVLDEKPKWKVKQVEINPGHRLSYQKHFRRQEHWSIVQGKALVILEGRGIALKSGQSIDIPKGAWHRIANAGRELLVYIEVQQGDYFGEDDIERIHDDYGRC